MRGQFMNFLLWLALFGMCILYLWALPGCAAMNEISDIRDQVANVYETGSKGVKISRAYCWKAEEFFLECSKDSKACKDLLKDHIEACELRDKLDNAIQAMKDKVAKGL